MLTMRITCTAFVLLIQTLQCFASDESPFQLTNKATGFCLVKTNNDCIDIRWTTGDRLLVPVRKKCLGVQGKSLGSEISLYDCDENGDLQKWECKNGTLLALKGQELYVELTADNTAVLSRTIGPNNHLVISGTSSGACTRTYRELYAIGGNAAGMLCMFPFMYKSHWFSDCTTYESNQPWCAIHTKFEDERWGFCPSNAIQNWNLHPTTGAYYQFNTQAALTWQQAESSCKQQGATLVSITDPHEQAYISAILRTEGSKLWTGLILDTEHGWKWSNGMPFRYIKWDSGHPLPNPGHSCAILDPIVQYSWQSSPCNKKLGYICFRRGAVENPTPAVEQGFCSPPWIPYNGHCFHIHRTQRKTWSDAQRECRKEAGDLVSIRNVEDQSFVISQLGYLSNDELWIGLNDRKTEGLFDWSDHSTVSFTSWEFGKPALSIDTKDCVLIKGEKGNWADHVCEEQHGFICMKRSASSPTEDEEVGQDKGCKTGWKRHGSYCYFIGTESKPFGEATNDCKSSNSYLVDVSNGVDNAFLVSLVGIRPEKHFWLGLSNQKNIDEFVWTNKDSVSFTHWNAEMPGHQQGCVAMKTGIFAGLWDVLPCTNQEKYICKHLAEGAVLTPPPPTVIPPKCAEGWTQVGTRKDCFKLFSESSSNKRSWYEARDYCMAIGGDLLSIHSTAELEALPDRYEAAWIGLSAPDPVTGYVWSDGSPLAFQHWEDGEPNNKNNVESCAEFKMHRRHRSGSWNDVHCETSHGWLCQIRAGVTPNPPPEPATPDYNRTSDGWLEWNGNQYYINRASMPMEDARQICQQSHSDLVTINSEAESVFLWKQISRHYESYWIGLTVDLDGSLDWMDGSPVVFQRWDENQPDFLNNDENCAVMTVSMGFWHDYSCGYEHRSICKRSGSPPVNATVAPTVPPKGGCPQKWKKFNSKCYSIINSQGETWDGARTQCRAMGGNLASILSRHEQVFLSIEMAKAPSTNLWIGLHNIRGYQFYWTDGRPMRYNNWGSESHFPRREIEDPFWMHNHPSLSFYHDELEYHHRPLFGLMNEEGGCAVMTVSSEIGIGKWVRSSCNDTNGYVCLRKLDTSLPDSPEPTVTTDYVKIFNDSIKVVCQPMNWDAALKHCQSDGANLASLRNEWSQIYIELMALNLNSPLWIGLNKKQTDGYFRYIDGWRMTLSKWGSREPRMDQHCVYVDVEGKWRTADCNQNMTSICMKTTDVLPTESSDYPGFCPDDPETHKYSLQTISWQPFKGHCYLFLTERIEWPDASASCVRHGGGLASIEDPSEQEFILSNVQVFKDSQTSFWIGLYKTHKGLWQWLDKTIVDYGNWDVRQPGEGTYGAIKVSDGKWRSGSRWYDRAYICKTPKVLREVPPTSIAISSVDHKTRGHVVLAVALVITAVATGIVIVLVLFKKSGHHIPIPEKLTTFDNPLFFNNERSQPDLVDTNKLVENAEEESPGSIVTV